MSSRKVFEEKVLELGFYFSRQQGGFYVLFEPTMKHFLDVRLMVSQHPNLIIHGSKNGLNIQAIGLFKFIYPDPYNIPEFFIFSFENPSKSQIEYLIIPESVLGNRIFDKNHRTTHNKCVEMVFWFMSDRFVYNASHLSVEGEWYFLSIGANGRMADGTNLDFTSFLNNWGQLTVHL